MIYLTSFILYSFGRIIGDLVVVTFASPNISDVITFIKTYYPTSEYWTEVFFPFFVSVPVIFLGGMITYFLNLATICARFMTKIYIRLASGRIGNFLDLIPLFDFGGTWVVETNAKEEINFSTGRGMYKEFILERGSDVLFFSSLVGALLLVILQKLNFVDLTVNVSNYYFKNLITTADFFTIITAFITLFILCLYIPSMWIFRDGEIKKIVFASGKDVKTATNISNTYREALGVFIGFGGIIGIGDIAINSVISPLPNALANKSTIFYYLAIYSYSLSFFIVMASILLPGICITMLRYMTKHEQFVLDTRQKLIKSGTGKSGSIQFTEVHINREIENALKNIKKEEEEEQKPTNQKK